MTAIILQFPQPTRPKTTRTENRQPCEVISLDAWRRENSRPDELDAIPCVPHSVHTQAQPHDTGFFPHAG